MMSAAGSSVLRVALIGASHWHAPFYFQPLIGLEGARLCAVSDPDSGVARAVAEGCGCPWFTDHRELLAVTRPDFAFALGPHADMPAIGHALIAAGVAFALEKPCGTAWAQVAGLRDSAVAAGFFAAVPLAFRCSDLTRIIRETANRDPFHYLSFRFIAGPPQRYLDSGCGWMLDPERSGGGCTINLAVHFFDLYTLLTGRIPSVVGALMSNEACGLAIEDYSAVTLRGGGASGVVETGYTLPGPTGSFDLRFSLRSNRHYFTATGADAAGADRLVTYTADGGTDVVFTPVSQVPYYTAFVRETLERFRHGQPPVADLSDMSNVMEVVEAAYIAAGRRRPVREEE
jgi:predicted dehydrogenase